MHDYLGPSPIFDDKQFQQVFQITRTIYQRICSICCEADAFFWSGIDCTNCMAIDVDVKILVGLKILAYSVLGSTYQDYFQMYQIVLNFAISKYLQMPMQDDAT